MVGAWGKVLVMLCWDGNECGEDRNKEVYKCAVELRVRMRRELYCVE